MDNFLYIANDYPKKSYGGRQNLSRSLERLLKKILKSKFYFYKLKKKVKNKNLNLILDTFQGKIDGINNINKIKIINCIKKNKISHIFIDGSNLGLLCKYIKQFDTNIKILVFFHNTEAKFFFDSFLTNKTIHSFGVMLANYFAERNCCNYCDQIITLTKTDKIQINKIYKKKTNYILPLFNEDLVKNQGHKYKINLEKNYILFVGSAFYANLNGIIWFVKKVLPKVKLNLAIVGYGFEKYRSFFKNKKIIYLGKSKNINKWYKNSNFVVSPIFSGSGMKNKVAEAMMFGKKIIGTKETFIGYEVVKNKIGYECNDEKSFIKAIKKLKNRKEIYNFKVRSLYKKYYSFEASLKKMKNILIKFEKNK